MPAKEIIGQSLSSGDTILKKYVEDLSDADFHARGVAGMNTIAWQIGHLISVERKIMESIKPGSCPPLPEGFDDQHSKETTTIDDPSKFPTKADYMKAWDAQHAATKNVLAGYTEEQLAAESPNTFGGMCPTLGSLINFMGLHTIMHVGQFVPVRRNAGKAIAI